MASISEASFGAKLANAHKMADAIATFNEQLEKDFLGPNLKHSVFWHKLAGSGIEGKIYPANDMVIQKINETISKFVRNELNAIVTGQND